SGVNLALASSGIVNLKGANNLGTGQTALDGGTLNIATSTALGSGTVTLTSGTIKADNTSGVLLTNAVTFNNANVTLGGVNPLLFGAGAVTLGGTQDTINVTNTAPTIFNNAIGGGGQFIKTGGGALILTGNSTYTSQTFVNEGAIQVQHPNALGG